MSCLLPLVYALAVFLDMHYPKCKKTLRHVSTLLFEGNYNSSQLAIFVLLQTFAFVVPLALSMFLSLGEKCRT